MLLLLAQIRKADEGVWAAALSCLLYLVCERRRIQRHRLDGIAIRALKALLGISWEYGWADEVHCRLVRIVCNLLYRLPSSSHHSVAGKPTLDLQQIDLMGGIETVFVMRALLKSITTAMNRDMTSGRLDTRLLEDVVGALDKLAGVYAHPQQEFMELVSVTLASEGLVTSKTGQTEDMPDSASVVRHGQPSSLCFIALDGVTGLMVPARASASTDGLGGAQKEVN
ncbi:hypothetical protein R1sor_016299 [Riccia sorocarpa]|uniref:Uncharacterized protein n=1 Tax=Riccia sorocarpa TaxID=122646 RepID=A0ABD3HIQ4_9MARC